MRKTTNSAAVAAETKEPVIEAVKADAAPKAPAKRKAAEKPAPVQEEIVVQFAGSEWSVSDLKEKVLAQYVAEGHQKGRISKLAMYVKPEEHKVYYVVNDKFASCVDFE